MSSSGLAQDPGAGAEGGSEDALGPVTGEIQRPRNRSTGYVRLSQLYASGGDGRRAALAMWAADVEVLQSLLWERGIGEAEDWRAQLHSVAQAVDQSVTAHAREVGEPASYRALVEAFRGALVDTFDASVHDLLVARLEPLEHLDELEPAPAHGTASAEARLGGRTVEQLAWDLRVTAADAVSVAHALHEAGDQQEAERQKRMACLASFEAFLVEAAVVAADTSLCTVDLRWDLAASLVSDRSLDDLEAAELLDRLAASLGRAEREAFDHVAQAAELGQR